MRGYFPRHTSSRIEYRIHWDEDGDSHDITFYEGKYWRRVQKIVAECVAGIDEPDCDGLLIQWIERVERYHDQHGEYMGMDEVEILWEREVTNDGSEK